MGIKMKGVLVRTILSAASAAEIPEHTDSIERMDSTHTHLTHPTATVVPEVERPGHTRFYLSLCFARLERHRRHVTHVYEGSIPLVRVFGRGSSLSSVEGIGK
jgi:hypothetical protein